MKKDRLSTDPLDPIELADAALDGDLDLDAAMSRGGSSSAAHVRTFRRIESILKRDTKNTPQGVDFTASVLAEVGDRRGWLDRSSRRLVWGGRLMAAAALLLAVGATLAVRRAAPELMPASPPTSALASVVNAGQQAVSQAAEPVATVARTIGTRQPVLMQLGELAGEHLLVATEGEYVASLVMPATSCEPESRGGVVVTVSLDASTLRTVESVTGYSQQGTLRLFRVGSCEPAEPEAPEREND